MPLSEFRKKKLLFVFNTFFDVNESGTIDKKDLDLAVQSICSSRGWATDNAKLEQTKGTLLKIWEGLKQGADSDQDGQISRDEWYMMWEEYAKDPDNSPEWQKIYMNFVFDLEDTSGDGSIDESEFCVVCRNHGVTDSEAREAFKKLQVGSEVNREKFLILWKDYFTSDDPNTPGNFIFGKTSF
ncbi:calexcitin-2 [Leptopilina boulardi]|uniref:calexcitin-2 n=1 Tax=Leptopilina boulardi TaxID=63433 RepID=UPI0021F53B7A|nr:calexcitin-2 [Leptopilina boulardi]XP_051159430.1 calexcitin-2 [Leptopilina boulardi]XP_051159431.1 calexcitin-2 [Leptopilina boulardi]